MTFLFSEALHSCQILLHIICFAARVGGRSLESGGRRPENRDGVVVLSAQAMKEAHQPRKPDPASPDGSEGTPGNLGLRPCPLTPRDTRISGSEVS